MIVVLYASGKGPWWVPFNGRNGWKGQIVASTFSKPENAVVFLKNLPKAAWVAKTHEVAKALKVS